MHLINLDVIPGRKGVDPTAQEIVDGMQQSLDNYEILDKRFPGKVLPVYHQGEPVKFLNTLLDATPYVCLSPRNDLPEKQRVKWAQEAHTKSHRFHGLATTGTQMMETVNWSSVDSASWIMTGGIGCIIINTGNKLKPISVSSSSPLLKKKDGHIENIPERDFVLDMISSRGFTYEELQVNDRQRNIWNMETFVDYQNSYKARHHYEKGLFDL